MLSAKWKPPSATILPYAVVRPYHMGWTKRSLNLHYIGSKWEPEPNISWVRWFGDSRNSIEKVAATVTVIQNVCVRMNMSAYQQITFTYWKISKCIKFRDGITLTLVFVFCCRSGHYYYYFLTLDAIDFDGRMHDTKMSKQIINKVLIFFFRTFTPPANLCFGIAQRYSLESNLPFYSQFPVDDFPISICAMIFASQNETHAHTHPCTLYTVFLDRQNIFRQQKTSVAVDTSSNSSSFDGILWTIFRSFVMEVSTIVSVICSLHLNLDVPSHFLYLSIYPASAI